MSPYQDVTAAVEPGSALLPVALAYGLVWVILLLFLLALWRRQGRVADELATLRQELATLDAADARKTGASTEGPR